MQHPFELRLSWIAPILLLLALLLNYGIAQANPAQIERFAPVAVHANSLADYSADVFDLSFPPANPGLIDDVLSDQGRSISGGDDQAGSGIAATPTPELLATPTALLGVPTVPPVLPTLPGLLPTVAPLLPTTVPAIVTQVAGGVGDILDDTTDAVGDIVDDTTGAAGDIVDDALDAVPIPIIPCILRCN